MQIKLKSSCAEFVFLVIVVLISIRLWSFQLISDQIYDVLEFFMEVLLLGLVILNFPKIKNQRLLFKSFINIFLFILILSSVGAYIYHGQSFILSFLIVRNGLFWLLYYLLHIYNIPVKKIINLIIVVGVIWALLNIIQQFTYPHFYFYNRDVETGGFIRGDIYRFIPYSHFYGAFLILYFFYKFLLHQKFINLLYVAIGLLGFYFTGTRQIAFCITLCIIISSLAQKGNAKIFASIFTIGIIGFIFYFGREFLHLYIELTTKQLESDDEIRKVAAYFFLFDYWPHWSTPLIGNGQVHLRSHYGHEIQALQDNYGLYRGDVGVIGSLNTYGILYIINIVLLNIQGIKRKYYLRKDHYLIFIFLFSFILFPLAEQYSSPAAIPFYCLIFYLVDKSYQGKKYSIILNEIMVNNN